MGRLFQTLWTGHLHNKQLLRIVDTIGIIDTNITPISSINHGLQLLTSDGDAVFPCKQCIARGVTETISYVNLSITTRLGEVTLDVTACIMCNGCLGHDSGTEYSIVFHADVGNLAYV